MLRFLSKLAFLTNLVFAFVVVMHWIDGTDKWDQGFVSHLIITAYFVATGATLIVNVCTLVLLLQKKLVPVENWLQWANLLFLILQIVYFQFT